MGSVLPRNGTVQCSRRRPPNDVAASTGTANAPGNNKAFRLTAVSLDDVIAMGVQSLLARRSDIESTLRFGNQGPWRTKHMEEYVWPKQWDSFCQRR